MLRTSTDDLMAESKDYNGLAGDRTDPVIIGPGKWDDMHSKAIEATDSNSQKEFIKWNTDMLENFPCIHCRVHALQYLIANPMEDSVNVIVDKDQKLGLFIWTWKFHNAVNARLKKPLLNWTTAYTMYKLNPEECSKSCTDAK